ncbi:MAG: hypothetical protein AAFR67_12010, partial [Chloroflexota bacterium]
MNKTIRQIGLTVIALVACIAIGYFVGSLIPDFATGTGASETTNTSDNDLWSMLSLILQMSIIAYIVILIQELGHSFGGYLADYTPYQVT